MPHTATLKYDPSLIREAAVCFWRRTVDYKFFLAFLVVAASLVVLLLQGDRSWVIGVLASVLALGAGFSAAIFFVHYHNAMRKYRGLESGQVVITASETTLSLSSSLGTASLPWSAVTEVWRSERVWLLLFSKAQFSTLPVSSMSPELQSFIIERVKAAGGKVA